MMSLMRPVLALVAALLVPAGALAQEKTADDVVVTAQKQMDRSTAQRFVNRITLTTGDQIARFDAPVCPVAIGFEPAIEQQIVARMRRVAAAAGAKLAKQGCAGNIALLTTDDGGALMRTLRSTHPNLLEGLQPREIDRLIARGGPVRSWTATAVVNEDGQRPGNTLGGNSLNPPNLIVKSASIVDPPVKQIIESATVVMDSAAVPGKSVIQLADYAVMRALARTRPVEGGSAGASTILALFDPVSTPPLSVTETDIAYLKALYAMPGNRWSTYQAARIAKAVKKASAPEPATAP